MRFTTGRFVGPARIAIAYSPALLFLILTGLHGIQGLRHDWPWIPTREGFISSAFATLCWRPDGVGAPRPYPTDYLLAMFDTAIVAVIGVKGLYPLFMLGTSAMCVYGARSLTRALGAGEIARFGISLFALYNPWVYTEFVAGHLGMIIAYGATLAYLGEALRSKPSALRLSLFICISAAQLQLFLLLLVFAASGALARRGFLPLLTGLIVALPTVVGILGNRSTLAAIPYNLTWQSVQSLGPIDAAALTGYFANYVAGFPPAAFDAVWAMGALAAIGLMVGRKTVGIAFLVLGIVAWLWSTGSTGPIGPVYSFAVVRVPALAIFRELYDLLAYVAIAYAALASRAAARNRLLSVLALAPGLILATTWCLVPPLRWLVPLRDLPPVGVSAPDRTRVAFMPDVQPLTFAGRGSGLDPDAYPRPNDVLSLNGLDASFPANVALRRYAITGDATELATLGVSRIISRPWLSTDLGRASATFAIGATLKSRKSRRFLETVELAPLSELSTFYSLRIAKVPPRIGSAMIFFGDGAGAVGREVPAQWKTFERPTVLRASHSALRAADAWVDVRLAYLTRPEVGQGLGGVITTSRTAYLSLEPGRSALVWVRGRLFDAKQRLIARETRGYSWVAMGADSGRVRCDGECIVVAQGNVPSGIDPSGRAPRSVPVEFKAPLPWLAVAVLPPATTVTLLRYAVGFDAHWLAMTPGVTFAHVRVETALNGWIVPSHAVAQRVVLVESIAATQLCFEFIAVVWTLWLCYRLVVSRAPVERDLAA